MDANLERKNSEELYRLYQEGKKLRLSNNILAFLLLSDIEEASNYFTELLLSKCGNPTLMRNINARICNERVIKYELFLTIYYVIQNYDVETIIERARLLSSKWMNILNNISNIDVSDEDLNEIETYYTNYVEMEKAISELNKDESCDILNTLVEM
jgi:hypothetical protein